MTDLIQDTGARRDTPTQRDDDPQRVGHGSSQSPGGSATQDGDQRNMSQGQESYPGDRAGGDIDHSGQSEAAQHDASVSNVATPEAGDTESGSTASADETGQAGVNDRPGKDKAHPYNG